jgi:hypothetical protein
VVLIIYGTTNRSRVRAARSVSATDGRFRAGVPGSQGAGRVRGALAFKFSNNNRCRIAEEFLRTASRCFHGGGTADGGICLDARGGMGLARNRRPSC